MAVNQTILCGGVKVSGMGASTKECLRLDLWGGKKRENISLNFEDIHARLLREVPPVFADLVEIATYVYCADQAIGRGAYDVESFGDNWRRHLHFHIPVRRLDFWETAQVQEVLCETVGFLSDDHYTFTFYAARGAPRFQQYFKLPQTDGPFGDPEQVLMFSGGLDSLAGAVEEILGQKRRVILVNHRSTVKFSETHKELVELLSKHAGNFMPGHLRIQVHKHSSLTKEYTQRSRSFLYAAIGATVARMVGLRSMRFYENGVVALNLPVCAQVVGGRATRTAHPRVLNGFQKLLSLAAEEPFEVDNPFSEVTRAEAIRKIMDRGAGDLIPHSMSCAHIWQRSNEKPHCGVCSQCIDRRIGAIAAGAETLDSAVGYGLDIFTESMPKSLDKMMMATYLERATSIKAIRTQGEFITRYPEVLDALPYMKGKSDSACGRVLDLYKRHALEVNGVIDLMGARHMSKIRERTLPGDCLLRIVYESASVTSLPTAGSEFTADNGESKKQTPDNQSKEVLAMPLDCEWIKDSFATALNGNRVTVFGGRFASMGSDTHKGAPNNCAGRIRLVLQDHAIEFYVLGTNGFKSAGIVRIVTDGDSKLIEFDGGVVRNISHVTFPDLEADEKSLVRSVTVSKGLVGDAVFGNLPTATLANGWKLIRLPSGQEVDLGGRRARRGLLLEAVWKYCIEKKTLEFPFETVLGNFNEIQGQGTPRSGGRFEHDVFRGQKDEFAEMFDRIGPEKNQVFRLKIRFVTTT
jgi:7-cyano-7-deazaguanine synthase in queuosine biosynthesis